MLHVRVASWSLYTHTPCKKWWQIEGPPSSKAAASNRSCAAIFLRNNEALEYDIYNSCSMYNELQYWDALSTVKHQHPSSVTYVYSAAFIHRRDHATPCNSSACLPCPPAHFSQSIFHSFQYVVRTVLHSRPIISDFLSDPHKAESNCIHFSS